MAQQVFLFPLWVKEWGNMGSGSPSFHKKDNQKNRAKKFKDEFWTITVFYNLIVPSTIT